MSTILFLNWLEHVPSFQGTESHTPAEALQASVMPELHERSGLMNISIPCRHFGNMIVAVGTCVHMFRFCFILVLPQLVGRPSFNWRWPVAQFRQVGELFSDETQMKVCLPILTVAAFSAQRKWKHIKNSFLSASCAMVAQFSPCFPL